MKRFGCWLVIDPDRELEEDEFPNPDAELEPDEAKEKDASLEIGDFYEIPVESVEFGRIAAQAARQVLTQKVREAERAQVLEKYLPRVGQLVSGSVKRTTREAVIVDLGNNAEAMLMRTSLIPREIFRVGDRMRALLTEIRPEVRGPQLMLSRTDSEMLIELFKVEVPEIAEHIIEIRAAARNPGSRAKIAVYTNDGRIDPVGACVWACAVRAFRRYAANWMENGWTSCSGIRIRRNWPSTPCSLPKSYPSCSTTIRARWISPCGKTIWPRRSATRERT